jgi:hypothetical protein
MISWYRDVVVSVTIDKLENSLVKDETDNLTTAKQTSRTKEYL